MNNLNMSIKDESIVKVKVFTIAIYFDNNDHAYSSIILASTLTIAKVAIYLYTLTLIECVQCQQRVDTIAKLNEKLETMK